MKAHRVAAVASLLVVGLVAPPAMADEGQSEGHRPGQQRPVVQLKDARMKFEINSTDGDGGIQVYIDADPWRRMQIFDPDGRLVFTTSTHGSVGEQGGTELFLESGEPPFSELPLDELLDRFPEGEYRCRGVGLEGERFVGSAQLTHDLPAGPTLVAPLDGGPSQDPAATTVSWEPVDPPNGSPIIGYQVLVVQPETGITALPKVVLDVMMPPTATSMAVPPGFLQPGTEYEWEVLAIEQGGNQTLSSSFFTTAP
jgi:Fibronectin type III domain